MSSNKRDENKLKYDLIIPEFDEELAKVLTYGAEKYEPYSWQKVENPVPRYYAALRRHIEAWRKGEFIDADSGLSHLAHAAANIMFLMHFTKEITNG